MNDRTRTNGLGGGVFLTLGPILGLVIGSSYGEPSIGLAAGLGIGVAIALAFWFWPSRS